MEKEKISNNTMAGMTDLPGLPALADSKSRYANDSLYPEEDELANALCLVNLIIRKNESPGRFEIKWIPEGTGYADV